MGTALFLLVLAAALFAACFLMPVEFRLRLSAGGGRPILDVSLQARIAFINRSAAFQHDLEKSFALLVPAVNSEAPAGDPPGRNQNPGDIAGSLKKTWLLLDTALATFPALRFLLKKIHIREFTWKTGYGFKDPFITGLSCGAIWSLKGAIISALFNMMNPDTMPVMAVVPDFEKPGVSLSLGCILATRIGHIMYAAAWMLSIAALKKRIGFLLRLSMNKEG